MLERDFWKLIKRNTPKVHWTRVESPGSPGVPDVNGCRDGVEAWLELTILRGRKVELRPAQVAWLISRSRAGGRSWIVARHDDGRIFVWPGHKALEVASRGTDVEPDLWVEKPYHWGAVENLIFS